MSKKCKEHCWHPQHWLLKNPPINITMCCWCGQEQRLQQYNIEHNHGPHAAIFGVKNKERDDKQYGNREAVLTTPSSIKGKGAVIAAIRRRGDDD